MLATKPMFMFPPVSIVAAPGVKFPLLTTATEAAWNDTGLKFGEDGRTNVVDITAPRTVDRTTTGPVLTARYVVV